MQHTFRHRDRHITIELSRTDSDRFHANVDGNAHEISAALIDPSTLHVTFDGTGRTIHVVKTGANFHVAIDGAVYALALEAAGAGERRTGILANPQIIAPMPGKVLQVLVREGQEVAEGDGLVILEAMKMENRITAEAAGTVKKINVSAGQMVEGGLLMMELDYNAG
jgi:biotin carboxyl carrier protein